MKSFIAAASLLALAFANPVIVKKEAIDATAYSYAADLSMYTRATMFSCMKSAGYSVVFIRGYAPIGSGLLDSNASKNIQNAYSAGLGTEVYMTPVPGSTKNGSTQFNEMYTGLVNQGINIRSIWIQVTSPINWSPSTTSNVNLINSIRAAAKAKGLSVGIYTNYYDWTQITGGNYSTPAASGEPLWYWSVYGPGVTAQSPPDFNDFRKFGGWSSPSLKQFAQFESLCNITVNREVFLATNTTSLMARRESEGPVVGNFIL